MRASCFCFRGRPFWLWIASLLKYLSKNWCEIFQSTENVPIDRMSLILLLTDTVYFLATVACLLLFLVVVIRSPPQAVVIVLQCGTCATAAPDVSAARRQHQMQEQPNNEGEHTEDLDAEIWETPVQETQPVRTRTAAERWTGKRRIRLVYSSTRN